MRHAACALVVCLFAAAAALAADSDVRSLIDAGHWKQARALVEPRVKANPSDADAAAMLSKVRQAFGDMNGALQLAETAVKLGPKVAEYHWRLASVLGEQAQKASVLRQFGLARRFRQEAEAAIALDPTFIDPRSAMISFYIQAPGIIGGDLKKADQMAQEIARIDPASGYLARAQVLRETHAAGDLEALYRQAADAATSPHVKFSATQFLVNWYLSQKPPRIEEAEQQARALQKIDAHAASGYGALANIYASTRRWADLDAVLAEGEKAVPDNLVPYFQAGRAIVLQPGSDYPRAERYLRKYLTQEPEAGSSAPGAAHWRLGQALEKLGKRPEAIAEIEQATRLNPALEEAKKDLRRLR